MHELKVSLLAVMTFVACAVQCYSQDATVTELKQKIELLELKLQLAEKSLELIEKECEALRKHSTEVTHQKPQPAEKDDQFFPGVVWAGSAITVIGKDKRNYKWAVSIAKRDGRKLEGAIAVIAPDGGKIEIPVTGTAPERGDGLVVLESPVIGRSKLYMRGNLRNGGISLAYSGVTPLGEKFFGTAALAPKN
ncbi:MAG: hypothetical protein JSS49_19710 [Planctomycetes bacterium]|nr:hypothetical protein [Planctomycetota bacterium]